MSQCNCQRIVPPLEHALECPVRVEFYGGKIEWDRKKAIHLEGETRWVYEPLVGVWKPHTRYFIYFQVRNKQNWHKMLHSGFIATNTCAVVNAMQLAQKMREMHYQIAEWHPGMSQELYNQEYEDKTPLAVVSHITEDPDTGYCIPGTPVLKLHLTP